MHDVIGEFAGTTLAGVPFAVPADLTAPTLLLFAWRQHQQHDVDSWIRAVGTAVAVLEVPVLARWWRPGRRIIDGGMASNMDARTRAQTMTVYADVAAFRRDVLGIVVDEVVVVLVDAQGRVAWHALGPADADGIVGLRGAAADLLDG